MSDISDWDAVPVSAGSKSPKTASGSNTADWDSVPVRSSATIAAAQDARKMIAEQVAKKLVLNHPAVGTGEAILNMGSSMIAKPLSDIAGLAATAHDMITGERDGNPTGFKQSVQDALTYEPRGATGKAIAEYNPISMIGKGWGLIGQEAGDAIKAGAPGAVRTGVGDAVAEAIPQAIGILGAKAGAQSQALKAQADAGPVPQALTAPTPTVSNVPAYIRKAQADFQNAKSAGRTDGSPVTPPGTTQTLPAAPVAAPVMPVVAPSEPAPSAKIAAVIQDKGENNPTSVARHTEASSLPVPIDLTKGMASGDVNVLSHEQNLRAAYPEMAQRFNGINGKLVDNIDAIRESAGPDVSHANHVDSGQALIDSYKAKDAALNSDISAKYKALEDANGGQFPVDGQAFVSAADAALAKKMKGRYLPPEIAADMDQIRNGGAMTYENFENMRTNLAAEARKAERAGDGNKAMATSLVRDALESIPITGETATIKPLADAARNAAKERFDLIKADPAYKAAINDSIPADKFIGKFVIDAPVKNVKRLQESLAHDPLAKQTVAASTVNFLRDRAMGSQSKFKQSGYNNGLKAIRPKLNDLVPPEQAAHLETLGKVSRYTQEQPEGSYVNNSNTHVAEAAKKIANTALDLKTLGASKLIRHVVEKNRIKKDVANSLKPGAGIKLSDFPK